MSPKHRPHARAVGDPISPFGNAWIGAAQGWQCSPTFQCAFRTMTCPSLTSP
jgi:hypothetical protein